MASITITRKFTTFPDDSVPLLSVHLPSSIEFQFDRGIDVNTYAKVEINGISFFATKIQTVGTVDTYKLIGSDIFNSLLGVPTFDSFDVDNLTLLTTVVCKGYSSAGAVIASATHENFWLTHAISASPVDGLLGMYQRGRTSSGNIYFTRWMYYFDKATKKITRQYNPPTGVFDTGDFTINIVNVPELIENSKSIAWLNSDGCYDRFDFNLISIERIGKKSNAISVFSDQLYQWVGNEFNITNDVEETISLRRIAMNAEHYEQMYFITQSPLIMGAQNGELYELSAIPAPLNPCKQNLNFTFSLKRKIHAQSY